MSNSDIEYGRLVAAWELREDYDVSWLSQPWDAGQPDDEATNDIAAGCACRIGRACLVEEASGVRQSYLMDTEEAARELFEGLAILYGEPGEDDDGIRIEPEAICNRCHAPKGEQAIGESCNNNCGGRVVAAPAQRQGDA
jgi:hypothetical protein